VIARVEIKVDSVNWKDLISELQSTLKGKRIEVYIMKLAMAAAVYYVWRERKRRLFFKGKLDVFSVTKNIFEDIRMKLIGLDSGLGMNDGFRRKWGLKVENKDVNDEGTKI